MIIKKVFNFCGVGVLCLLLSVPSYAKVFEYEYYRRPDKPRNVILPSLVSFILPGADQWYEGQFASAGLYTGYAFLASSVYSHQTQRIDELGIAESSDRLVPFNSREQRQLLGGQGIQFAGSMSAYHAFRSAVKTRHELNEYMFLKDNPDDLLNLSIAPFKLNFLSRWTTLLPLGLIATLATVGIENESKRYQLTPRDVGFIGGVSYHAGVGEEAIFRGVLYPYLYEKLDSHLYASLISSGIFSALHLSDDNKLPVAQFALGAYLDYVTRKNKWSIQESIFIHFWWDIFALGASFIVNDEDNPNGNYIRVIETQF